MKKILVPVDFSECSANALKVAATLAKKNGAEIVVLHMIGLSESIIGNSPRQDYEIIQYIKLVEKKFEEFLDKDYLRGLNLTDSVYNYQNFSDINKLAKEHQASLIIMGSHGTSGLNEMFVGSNTEKVVRTSDVPVLVVKGEPKNFSLDHSVFVSDFSSNSIDVYKRAMSFFDKFNTKVELVYINLPADKFRSNKQLRKRFRDFMEEAEEGNMERLGDIIIYNDYSVEAGVFQYAETTRAPLITIPTHGRRGLAHFFSGSIGEDIVNRSDIPVLTFKI